MPVAQSRGHAGKALLVAGIGVAVALGLAFAMAVLVNRGDVRLNLGDDRFEAGEVASIARRIERDGGLPVLYPDLVGRDRHIFVQHLADDANEGWVAFSAFDPEEPACRIELDRDARQLVNACDPAETYRLDGRGLRYYPTTVEGGELFVDINELSTATTAPG